MFDQANKVCKWKEYDRKTPAPVDAEGVDNESESTKDREKAADDDKDEIHNVLIPSKNGA